MQFLIALIFAQAYATAGIRLDSQEIQRSEYSCVRLVPLKNPMKHLAAKSMEGAVEWGMFGALFAPPSPIQIVRLSIPGVPARFYLHLARFAEIGYVESKTLTLDPSHLSFMRETVAAGTQVVDAFQKQVLLLNETYDWAIDNLVDTLPIPRRDPLFKILGDGFQIFADSEIGFVLSADYKFLAVCPSAQTPLDLEAQRDHTFQFLSNPRVTEVIACEALLLQGRNPP